MRLFSLFLMMFVMEGCHMPRFLSPSELDTFHIVSYGKELKHYRAYFTRQNLAHLPNGKRTMFFYHPSRHSVAVLLRRGDTYELYDMKSYTRPRLSFRTKKAWSYALLLRKLAAKGYRPADLRRLGIRVTTGPRRYRGVKTWLIEIEDFSRLKQHYLEAIGSESDGDVSRLKLLPPELIAPELHAKLKDARTPRMRARLLAVAEHLHIDLPKNYTDAKKERYTYYVRQATEAELRTLVHTPQAMEAFDDIQRRTLRQRLRQLEHKRLLTQGSLDELIEAYRKHKDPLLKRRIMQLLESEQTQHPSAH